MATLSVFAIFIYPDVKHRAPFSSVEKLAGQGWVQASLIFAFTAVLFSLVFALTALPVNRILEGYGWPMRVSRYCIRRQMLRARRLKTTFDRTSVALVSQRGELFEKFNLYPRRAHDVMPTRLGNAYKAIESYGSDSFGLDLQSMNYELFSVANQRLLQDSDDTRAQVDFFIGFVAQLSGLAASSLILITYSNDPATCAWVAVVSIGLARLAYLAAVKNMTDLGYSMQALINVGRSPLASALGYKLPQTLAEERTLWRAWTSLAQTRDMEQLKALNALRSVMGQEETSSASRSVNTRRVRSGRRAISK